VLDEDADFGRHPAAGGTHGEDWYRSLIRSEKAENSTFSEFCSEEPRRRLGNPEMFKDTHPHLFYIAGPKDSRRDNAFGALPGAEDPRLRNASLGEDNRSMAREVFRRLRRTVVCEVLRSGDENDHRLGEPSRNQTGVWQIPRMDGEIVSVLDDRCWTFRRGHLNCHVGVGCKECR